VVFLSVVKHKVERMAEARKASRLATLGREEQRLLNEISNHEYQLQTELNDSKREELILALKINGLELEINGYKIDLENATTVEEKSGLRVTLNKARDTLNKARDTLNELLQQKHTSGTSLYKNIFDF
jgi:hypothetical protein